MKLRNFISNCRCGRVVNSHGRNIFVPCGHCPDCYNRKSDYYTRLCEIESMSHAYTYFFTLTYNDECVPKAQLIKHETGDLSFIDRTSRPLKLKKKNGKFIKRYKPVPEYGSAIGHIPARFYDSNLLTPFIEKATSSFKTGLDNPFYKYRLIRYCRKKDIQNFFKRLRFQISLLYDIKISYYVVAEYGPEHFRPHYHAILYFDDRRLVEDLEGLVSKCWKLGNVNGLESARKASNCAKYVSSYCNSFTHLPRFLSCPSMAPFSLHSRYFAKDLYSYLRDIFYDDPVRSTGTTTLPSPFGPYTYYPTSHAQSYLYPRCYGYDRKDSKSLRYLYTVFKDLREQYGTRDCSLLTFHVLNNPRDHVTLLRHLDLETDEIPKSFIQFPDVKISDPSTYEILLFDPAYFCLSYSDLGEFFQKVFRRVYSALYLSRHFIEFCCVGRSELEVFNIIHEYYTILPLVKLRQQYEQENSYYYDTFDTDYTLFYPLKGSCENPDYQPKYDSSSYIDLINNLKNYDYGQKVKHKLQNDKNLMFV